ncbi:MAG: hypothetical protein BWX47_00539 [candidate division Hyd24-12 bacterium ADurb.Bin004]|nr:MAG: hypothetical protein BWX47_00539 [candidate division Hyd24-12 bacterium ADurb.Bin004]
MNRFLKALLLLSAAAFADVEIGFDQGASSTPFCGG